MSTGDAQDFGDLYGTVYYPGGVSNKLVEFCWWVSSSISFWIRIILIILLLHQKEFGQDFGDFTARNSFSTFGSPTRGCFAGGATPGKINTIEYVTIASTGNATDFGDLTIARNYAGGCGSAIED